MALKIGDVIESAIWITGEESYDLRKFYEADVCAAIEKFCDEQAIRHGPVVWLEKAPGTDRVPEVPDHIQGPRVRLLVAEAAVTDVLLKSSQGSFVANLEKRDLERLRAITRKASCNPLSDKACDQIIEQCGPEAALDTLRQQVGKTIH